MLNDPDETRGRAMYRDAAEAQARFDMARARHRVRYITAIRQHKDTQP